MQSLPRQDLFTAVQSVFGQRSATDRLLLISLLAPGAWVRINYECGVKGSNFTATAHKCPMLHLEKVRFRQFKLHWVLTVPQLALNHCCLCTLSHSFHINHAEELKTTKKSLKLLLIIDTKPQFNNPSQALVSSTVDVGHHTPVVGSKRQ